MRIDGNGFVTDDLISTKKPPAGSHSELFDVLIELNKFAENLKYDFVIEKQETPEEKQRVIAVIAFVRLLEIVQSALILAMYGVREELNSLFRVFLDAYFILTNCCRDADFISTYFLTDEPERLKLMNVAAKYKSDLFKKLNEYATKEIKDELEKRVRNANIQTFNSYLFAENVGCGELYDSLYRLTSSSIHTSPRCLDHYVEADKLGNITLVKHKPDPENTNRTNYNFSWFLIKAIRGICELFGLDYSDQIVQFENKLEKAGSILPKS